MRFEQLNLSHFDAIKRRQAQTRYNGSEYSELYLRGWRFFNFPSMQIAEEADALFLRFRALTDEDRLPGYTYLPPLTTDDRMPAAFASIARRCEEEGAEMNVIGTPAEYVALLDGEKYAWQCDERSSEYLYLPEDLIGLAGKKYHGKRNHFKRFVTQNPDYVFRKFDKTRDREGVMQLFGLWRESKSFDGRFEETENDEERVLRLALEITDHCVCGCCFADVLEAGGRIVAFTMGERSPSGVGIVHLEKADTACEGAYTAINKLAAEAHFADMRLINRQEDMGLEGLRRAKRSYYPVAFAEKYHVTRKK